MRRRLSAFGGKADMIRTCADVRLLPKADINTAVGFWCAPLPLPRQIDTTELARDTLSRRWGELNMRGRATISESCWFSRRCTGSLNGTLPFQLCQRGSEAAQPPVVRCDIGSTGRPFALAPRGHRIYALSHLPVSYSGHHKLR